MMEDSLGKMNGFRCEECDADEWTVVSVSFDGSELNFRCVTCGGRMGVPLHSTLRFEKLEKVFNQREVYRVFIDPNY